MPCIIRQFITEFWNPYYWLPPNVTWEDMEARKDITYPDHLQLGIPILCAALSFLARYLLEKYIFSPLGLRMGVKVKHHKKVPRNSILEKAYVREKKSLLPSKITALAKQLDWSERQVERWLRLRCVQDKPTIMTKFCESCWRFLYYSGSFMFGMYVLWDKPWLWDIHECWTNYPFQSLPDDVWWYYMLAMTFYWSVMFSHYFDTKRKDFWQMFLHHCATICLLCASWICNQHRLGTLMLLIHDVADAVMEAAKMAKYSNHMEICNVLFIMFAITWMTTRLGIYPFWILYNAAFDAPKVLSYSFSYFFSSFLLTVLFFLHSYWSYLILCIIFKYMKGETLDDIRSSSDGGFEESGSGDADSNAIYNAATTTVKKVPKVLKGDPGGDMNVGKNTGNK